MQTKKLLDSHENESIFKLLVVFNYKSKFNKDFDAKANIFSKDFLEERYGPSKHFSEYTAYGFLKSWLYRLCAKNDLKVAELYWNTKLITSGNYLMSFKPIAPFKGFEEYFNPNKPQLITHRPKELIKSYDQYQAERKFNASIRK